MRTITKLLIASLALASCQRETDMVTPQGKVEIEIAQTINGQPFSLNTPYLKPDGEDLFITKYKYYISNVSLIDSAAQAHTIADRYFLVDKSSSVSQQLSVSTDPGRYSAVRFMIGVDSIRNVSGAQDGALDPALDMFWTWNTGYVMAKMEGTSSFSTLPNNKIEYHIGGFKGTEKVQRWVQIPFTQLANISTGKTLKISLNADVLAWFSGIHNFTITQNPTCTSPGLLASRFADNYANMFSLNGVQEY